LQRAATATAVNSAAASTGGAAIEATAATATTPSATPPTATPAARLIPALESCTLIYRRRAFDTLALDLLGLHWHRNC
jgi:hypothetical protein